jgi:signal transduction histidine kinase/CheY-like chemotaxis protein
MMKSVARKAREARQGNRVTMLLQVSVVLLVVVLFSMLLDIASRYTKLQDGFRENAVWSMYQLDRESWKFLESLHRLVDDGDKSRRAIKTAVTRYDIVFSRIKTVEKGRFDINVSANTDITHNIMAIRALIRGAEPIFNALALGREVPQSDLEQTKRSLDGLLPMTEELLVYINNAASTYRADTRTELQSLQLRSAALIGLLVICVACLVYSLRRQLRSMREAGASLEAMAERLNSAYLDAEAGNRAKSQFMATIGHEVRTPLNAILGTAELLQLSALPPTVCAGITTIRRSGESLLEIINEVLDFAKIEHGNLAIETRAVDIREVAVTAMEIIRDRAVENGNEVRFVVDPGFCSGSVLTDPTRLRQVLLNLMSNAAKFTSGGLICLRLSEIARSGSSIFRFEISDTGIGIDPAGLSRLFQPFTQVDATISRRFGGTGLGLAICKQIVEALGGRIGAESQPGQGSTFWFEIPKVSSEELVQSVPADACPEAALAICGPTDATTTPPPVLTCATAVAGAALPQLSILLVEDNKINQQVATGLLRHLGQSVCIASDGLQAVSLAQSQSFDLVLMDMQMPVMDGIEASRRIRALGGKAAVVPIVAMTANASDHDRELCLEAGMDGFWSKPISLDQLRKLIVSAADSCGKIATPAIETGDFMQRSAELVAVLGEHDFIDLLRHFFVDADELLADLSEAVARNDLDAADRVLHSLKGAATSVCLQELAHQIQDLRRSGVSDHGLTQLRDGLATRRQRLAA